MGFNTKTFAYNLIIDDFQKPPAYYLCLFAGFNFWHDKKGIVFLCAEIFKSGNWFILEFKTGFFKKKFNFNLYHFSYYVSFLLIVAKKFIIILVLIFETRFGFFNWCAFFYQYWMCVRIQNLFCFVSWIFQFSMFNLFSTENLFMFCFKGLFLIETFYYFWNFCIYQLI